MLGGADRAADVAVKQERVAALLRETEREGLLILDPANLSWLTSGAVPRGLLSTDEYPGLFFQGQYRWLLCANVDSQRFFDEELDGLGFQLKEWPWHWGRGQMLADICHGKKLAADVPFSDCLDVGARLRQSRRQLSAWEQSCLRELGKALAHAVEASGRNFEPGDSEEEIAGQLSHRLVHHGIEPMSIFVASDGRSRKHRRGGATAVVPQTYCVISATARRQGIYATASRIISLGPVPDEVRKDFDMACRFAAVQIAYSVPQTKWAEILRTAIRILEINGYEHEWRQYPMGWLTGYAAVEELLYPTETSDALETGMAVVWPAVVGAVSNSDTVLVTEQGPEIVTVSERWPLKYIKVATANFQRPDVLVRER
jgi:Xaa-Pro aminopeptidase